MNALPSRPLEGRHVVITGAAQGIGAAIAETLAHQGAVLTLAGRRQPVLETLAQRLQAVTRCTVVVMDVSDANAVAQGFAQARAAAEAAGQLRVSGALRFALAHHGARCLVGAMRFVQGAALPEAERCAAARQVRASFAAISPLDVHALARAYVRRGWWLRAARLLRAWGAEAA